jgi:hypothetical protein
MVKPKESVIKPLNEMISSNKLLSNSLDVHMLTHILLAMCVKEPKLFARVLNEVNPEHYNRFLERSKEECLKYASTEGKDIHYNEYFQEKVKLLMSDKYEGRYETEVFSGFYPLDVYFPKERLIVEINGSTHFYNQTNRMLPKYRLKEEILEGGRDAEGR